MTGYLYRGKPDLEVINERIMAEREANSSLRGRAQGGHGTEAGARRHWRKHEKACASCALAASQARERRKAGG